MTILTGGTFEPGNGLRTVVNTITCAGDIRLGSGIVWHVSPGMSLAVEATGRLLLEGQLLDRCRIDCEGLGTWRANLAGSLIGHDFELADLDTFRGPGDVGGVRLLPTTNPARQVVLESGVLAGAAADANAALLWLQGVVSFDAHDLDFVDSGSVPFKNVATTAAPPSLYRFFNYDGNLGGPAFESDPNGVVDWIDAGRTTLTQLSAMPGSFRVQLGMTTGREVTTTALQVHRAQSAEGPYSFFTSIQPLTGTPTSGASYSALDAGLGALTRFHYRIFDDRPGQPLRLLGEISARTWPQQVGNAWFVGPGGYADIGAALAAAPAGAMLVVASGTYPAFSVSGRAVRIVADGSGPVFINTAAGPVLIQNVPLGAHLLLQGLRLAGVGGAFGLDVVNCQGSVVLDDLEVTTGALGTALKIDNCPRVALQKVTLQGGTGLDIDNQSVVYGANSIASSLQLRNQSRFTFVDWTIATRNVQPGATVNALTGTGARMEFAPVLSTSRPYTIDIISDPGDFFALAYGARDFLDASLLGPIEMVLLLQPGTIQTSSTGLMPSGFAQVPLNVPEVAAWWGTAVPLQVIVLHTFTLTFRLGNCRDLLIVP
jgi:hypothetical protein